MFTTLPDVGPVASRTSLLVNVNLTGLPFPRLKIFQGASLEWLSGRDALLDLTKGADCVIESMGVGALEAVGLGHETLQRNNPSLVIGTLTAFGHTGPKAQWPATDLTLMASACTMAFTGDSDRSPVRVALPQAFHFGAAVLTGGVVAALYERGRSGLGQIVDVAAQQVIPMATQAGVLAAACNFPTPTRTGGGLSIGPIDLRLVYPARDGFVSITHVFGDAIGPMTGRLMDWVLERSSYAFNHGAEHLKHESYRFVFGYHSYAPSRHLRPSVISWTHILLRQSNREHFPQFRIYWRIDVLRVMR